MIDQRRLFRLVDMIVAIFVIGLLWGLVMCVGSGRESGRRAQCQNNMRNVCLALIGFQHAKNAFPNSGTFDDDPADHEGDPRNSTIYRALVAPSTFANDPSPLRHSWVVDLLPYLDQANVHNGWDRDKSYLDQSTSAVKSNSTFAPTRLSILRCPNDPTLVPDGGNLSYVVNGGFSRWYAIPVGWEGSNVDGKSANGGVLRWTPAGSPWQDSLQLGRKLGVMFPGTRQGDQPWDVKTTPKDLTDGASTTLLVGENTLVGVSKGTKYSGGLPTNWACPLPNFTTFLGSDNVCRSHGSATDCLAGQLAPTPDKKAGAGWNRANDRQSSERINGGSTLTIEGSFPYINSGHPGGANFVFCDGAVRFISETIDGTVYAELVTPAGSTLPTAIRQPARVMNPQDEW